MARYTDASCRLCRREGQKMFLKGERCYSGKCAIEKRAYAPGQHGQGRSKKSEYGLQLREKQKTKRYYGLLESQFRKYFDMAVKKQGGQTGEKFLAILESRLDNVVYRLGLATSRAQARQMVTHKLFTVNGKMLNIPSYLVKPGDVISPREKSINSDAFKAIYESVGGRVVPKWLDYDKNTHVGKVISLPERADIDLEVSEHLIVELYSK
jgi:small subunit ribosomal protein S4